MNKLSLAGLIFGLILLSSLFFTIGFLASIATFGNGSNASQPTWATANSPELGKPSSFIGKLPVAIASSLLHDQAIKLESRLGGGIFSKVTNKVPMSLQPFAAQAQNQLTIRSQQNIRGITQSAVNKVSGVFSSNSFGSAQRYRPRQGAETAPPSRPAFAPPKSDNRTRQAQPIYYRNYATSPSPTNRP